MTSTMKGAHQKGLNASNRRQGDEETLEPPEIGEGGSRPKTNHGQNSAIKHFDEFVEYYKEKGKLVGSIKEVGNRPFAEWKLHHFAQEEVYRQFAHYLAKVAVVNIKSAKSNKEEIKSDDDGQALFITTALQYHSNFVNKILDHVKEDPHATAEIKAESTAFF